MGLKYIIIFLVFLFFLISITILLNPTLCFEYQDYARDLLIHFVETTKLLYGPYYITHNFHALTHIADDVTTFGSLDNCSAFQYEDFLQFFKRQIRKGDRPLQQMVKRLGEMADSDLTKNLNILPNPVFQDFMKMVQLLRDVMLQDNLKVLSFHLLKSQCFNQIQYCECKKYNLLNNIKKFSYFMSQFF